MANLMLLSIKAPVCIMLVVNSYVCLARLRDYFDFISEHGEMLYHLFESNVRDYQRDTEVNKEIQGTLTHPTEEDFWWLNNGITIIATKAQPSAESLTIAEGYAEAQRGELIDADEVLRGFEARKRAWLAEHRKG